MRISKPKEERKLEIIETARDLFLRQGIEDTPVSQIVKTVGVAQGLFYYYFKSKKDIVLAVTDHIMDAIETSIRTSISRKDLDFHQKLTGVVDLFLNAFGIMSEGQNAVYSREFYAIIKDRITSTTISVIYELIEEGTESNALNLRYPDLMVNLIIEGLAELISGGLRDRDTILTLIEQALNMESGSLA